MKKKTVKIQPNHTEKKEDYSPETVAKNFWKDWHLTIAHKISDSIMNRLDIDPAEKKHHIDYISKKKSLPSDLPVGSIEDQLLDFKYLQKPNTDWDKIKECLRDFNVDNKDIELVVFILKRAPSVEWTLSPRENPAFTAFNKAADSMMSEFNQKIRELSPLVNHLEKLQEDTPYKDYFLLTQPIEVLKYHIALYREIIKNKRDTDKRWLGIYCLDKDLKKSPQKHKYWNVVVSDALKMLNLYCHNGNCDSNCRKTHQKAITKVAELLKILYPSIWKEDIQTIANRIKQKDYRNIPM